MVEVSALFWVIFFAGLLVAVGAELLFTRGEITLKKAWGTIAVWVALASAFAVGIHHYFGQQKALEFTTGYIIEYCLSVDNLFVFAMLFQYFKTPEELQPKILYLGILGAVFLRGILLLAGTALIQEYSWIMYIFGGFLIFTGYKLAFGGGDAEEIEENAIVRWARKVMPISKNYHGRDFFAVKYNYTTKTFSTLATPLLLVLIAVETTDLIFAMDSIPAILAISQDPFIVITSNVFAIMGLRSLYFILAGMIKKFHYLQHALAFILSFIGVKMLLTQTPYHPSISVALTVVLVALVVAVIASIIREKSKSLGVSNK